MKVPTFSYHRILRFQDWLDINYPGENMLECSTWLFEEYCDYEHEMIFGLKPVEKEFQDKRPWFVKLEEKQGTLENSVTSLSSYENNLMYTTPVYVDSYWWWKELSQKEREEFQHDAGLLDEKIIPKRPSRFGSFNIKRDTEESERELADGLETLEREMSELKVNLNNLNIIREVI